MTARDPGRIASIRQRLLNHAKAGGEEFQFVLDRYAVERLLYRLSISGYRDQFLLKGAMLFALWFDEPHRPTRDADFLAVGTPDAGQMLGIVQVLLDMDVDDGLVFVEESLGVTEIREDAKYDGLRVTLRARLGTANCMVQWDIGFGDAVTPGPQESELPTLLDDMPAPRLRVYPRETVFAEKVEALTVLGMIDLPALSAIRPRTLRNFHLRLPSRCWCQIPVPVDRPCPRRGAGPGQSTAGARARCGCRARNRSGTRWGCPNLRAGQSGRR